MKEGVGELIPRVYSRLSEGSNWPELAGTLNGVKGYNGQMELFPCLVQILFLTLATVVIITV